MFWVLNFHSFVALALRFQRDGSSGPLPGLSVAIFAINYHK